MSRPATFFAAAALALSALAFSAAPAAADPMKDATCIWNKLPAAVHDATLAGYKAGGPGPMVDALKADAAGMDAASAACKVTGDATEPAARTLMLHVLKVSAGRVLKDQYKVDPAAIDKGWAGLPAADRQRFINVALKPDDATKEDFAFSAGLVNTLPGAASLPDEEARRHLAYYMFAVARLSVPAA
ncbi:MAG: hypothetical protein JWP35_2223 [Caulobacter sp.]|nr:hypothetical protein [Caulobacter sp.]